MALEVDRRRAQAAVGGAAPQPVALHGEHVKARTRPRLVHALQIEHVVGVAPAEVNCRADGPGDDHDRGVNGFQGAVGAAQQVGVRLGIDRLLAPFGVEVWLVPHLVVLDAPAIARRHGDRIVHEVLKVGRWRVAVVGALWQAPGGHGAAQSGDDLQGVLFGQGDDVIVLVPGADRPVHVEVAPVGEVALSVNLDVFPGELLANPAEARLGDHLHLPLALGRLDLLLQERVDGEGIHVSQGDVGEGLRVGLGARPADEVLPEAEYLFQRGGLAGDPPQVVVDQPLRGQVEGQRAACDQDQHHEHNQRAEPEAEQRARKGGACVHGADYREAGHESQPERAASRETSEVCANFGSLISAPGLCLL